MTNPLENLLVDSEELDAELLASTLQPYIRIDKRTNEIRGTSEWRSLTAIQKTIAYLLARKGMVALQLIDAGDEPATPSVIERNTGVKGPTLRPLLSSLHKSRVLDKNGSAYFVPTYNIERARAQLDQAAGGS